MLLPLGLQIFAKTIEFHIHTTATRSICHVVAGLNPLLVFSNEISERKFDACFQ